MEGFEVTLDMYTAASNAGASSSSSSTLATPSPGSRTGTKRPIPPSSSDAFDDGIKRLIEEIPKTQKAQADYLKQQSDEARAREQQHREESRAQEQQYREEARAQREETRAQREDSRARDEARNTSEADFRAQFLQLQQQNAAMMQALLKKL